MSLSLDGNPFQVLTLIVAPAISTNSSSLLSLSTSNRFARVVDRSRVIYEKLRNPETLSGEEKRLYDQQLHLIGRRSMLLVTALTWFYVSVGAFAATSLSAILGAGMMLTANQWATNILSGLALLCGVLGVIGLVTGAGILVREMWLAQTFLRAEIANMEALLETNQLDQVMPPF